MSTRQDYLNKKVTHEEYYGQFVNESVINYVSQHIGTTVIIRSNDPRFNDIPLKRWDALAAIKEIINRNLLREAENWKDKKTYPWSLNTQVCIAKEAARQIKLANLTT